MIGFAIITALSYEVRAEDAVAPLPDQQILLLRNGQILEGKITHTGDQYVVEIAGGQVRVKNADVEMLCHNLQEGYQRKRSLIQVGDVHQHLELAQWCMQHHLWDLANNELDDAAAIEPQNPKIGSLRHRLEIAKEPPPVAVGKVAEQPITNNDLDRMVRTLPHGSVDMFTQMVQPVLMNNCMSAGCHGTQNDQKLQLFRTTLAKGAGNRLTQRNLFTVLQYVDRTNPADSRLLKAISEPHGTVHAPIFADRQNVQYQRIANWVDVVAYPNDMMLPPGTASEPVQDEPFIATPHVRVGAAAPRLLPQEARKADIMNERMGGDRATNGERSKPHPGARATTADKRGADASKSANVSPDPFDPEAFNKLQTTKK
jgi:hypothetical protein